MQNLNSFLKENVLYKIEPNIEGDFIRLTALNGKELILKYDSKIYDLANQFYKDNFLKKFEELIFISTHMEVRFSFSEKQKYYKPYDLSTDDEKIFKMEVLLSKDDEKILLYIIDKMFDNDFKVNYNNIYDKFGKRDGTKFDFYSYSLTTNGKKLEIDNIPEELDKKVKKLIIKKNGGKKLC